ncbi:bestrophin family protein [Allocoleopsis sp.]|uniref:bestrophin family protein n=1 Tax=Allocoleopsis sp. TaxID=3088169 RepID=UPI002FD5663F
METKRRQGFRGALQRKGSVVPVVFKQVLLCGLFGFLISSVHNLRNLGFSVSIPLWGGVIPTIVIALLLVIRAKTAYERFLEGRKNWGDLINTVRNQARQVWVGVREIEPADRAKKLETIRLLVAFTVASKLHLREEPVNGELEYLISSERYLELKKLTNPPLQIAFWIGNYLQEQYNRKCLNSSQLTALHQLLDQMVNHLGACERIIKTPVPLAYAIHLRQLVLIYCLSLPFQMVGAFLWLTGPIVALISFALLGLEEISREMENPFGYDDNDLPLDLNCDTMLHNIEDLISQELSSTNWQLTSVN